MEKEQIVVVKTFEIMNGSLDFSFKNLQNIEGTFIMRYQKYRAKGENGSLKHTSFLRNSKINETSENERWRAQSRKLISKFTKKGRTR